MLTVEQYEKMHNKAITNKYDIVGCDVDIVYPSYHKEYYYLKTSFEKDLSYL